MSLHLAIFPQAVWTSPPRAAQQPVGWTDWDLAPPAEEACALTERATLWTHPTDAPPSATRPQRSPSHQMPSILGIVALKGAMHTHCHPHTTLCLMVKDTPAPSPPSSDRIATPCTCGGTTRGHTGRTRGWQWVRGCPLEPAAFSSCLRSCSTARCLATPGAPPERKT